MADMKYCPMCACEIPEAAKKCPFCCEFLDDEARYESILKDRAFAPKSRLIYILLGLCFGWIGLHNFYSGDKSSGRFKLILLCVPFIGWLASTCLTICDICTVKEDESGRPLV